MKVINVGIVGCGGFGNFHIDNLLKIEGVNICAIASRNVERLNSTAKKLNNPRLYTSYEEMINDCDLLDAVVITLPPGSHDGIEQMAAKRGLHMYIEKPIELSIETALKNEQAIKNAGVICSVGYQARYNTELAYIKELVANQKTGVVTASWLGGFPGVAWWKNKSLSGGQIVEQATHLFDVLRYIYGDIKTVYTQALTGINDRVTDSTIEDCSATVITFENGIVGTVVTGCYMDTEKSGAEVNIKLYTENMQIEFDWGGKAIYTQSNNVVTKNTEGNNHFTAMSEFIKAVASGDTSNIKSDYTDAIKTLRATLATNESIATGQAVKV